MFDLAELDIAAGSDEGREMTLISPKTKAPVRDEHGKPIAVTLLGRYSQAILDLGHVQQQRRIEAMQRGRVGFSTHEQDENNTELLVAATRGWSIQQLDGQPFPFSAENARRLWTDRRFWHIRQQALEHINNDAVFAKA